MVYIATLPPAGELRTTWDSTAPGLDRPREVVDAPQRGAGRLQPVFRERALKLVHHRALDPHVGVAPEAFLPAVAAPLAARARAPGDADPPVRDQDPPMVPVVGPVHRPRGDGAIRRDLAARLGHPTAVLRGHEQRADRVEEHVNLHPGPAALRQGLSSLRRGRALFEHVLRVGDGLAGGPDHLELRGEDLLSVQEDVDPVASDHRPAGVADERGPEGRLGDAEIGDLEVGLDVVAAGERQEKAGDGQPVGRRPSPHRVHSRRRTSMRSPVSDGC
jgi:hypothetical protein